MSTRRDWLQSALLLGGTCLTGRRTMAAAEPGDAAGWIMPDEAARHRRTWMAFGASRRIWGRRLLPEVRRNLAEIARTIARFEPVTMLVRQQELPLARELAGDKVELLACPLDDLWIRDSGPLFVAGNGGSRAAVDFNFNGWGEKQQAGRDTKVARFVARQAGAKVLETELVLEGGCVEQDGQGTAIVTESCVLNRNRNPGVGRAQFEQELARLLGVKRVIWLPGIRGHDITDGHTDFYARFVRPGVVLAGYDPDPQSYDHEVTKEHLKLLRSATDARGRRLNVTVLEGPRRVRPKFDSDDFAAGYIGFYVCNGAVVMQEFGDKRADAAARRVIQQAFPQRTVVALNVDGIAAGGGSIHCATQQEPLAGERLKD